MVKKTQKTHNKNKKTRKNIKYNKGGGHSEDDKHDLMIALQYIRVDKAREVIEKDGTLANATLDYIDRGSNSKPLHILLDIDIVYINPKVNYKGVLEICKILINGYEKYMNTPEKKYKFINSQDSEGTTPLYLAVKILAVDTVKLLLDNGANVNIKNKHGEGIFNLVARHALKYKKPGDKLTRLQQICDLLLNESQYTPDLNAKGDDGKTPLQIIKNKDNSIRKKFQEYIDRVEQQKTIFKRASTHHDDDDDDDDEEGESITSSISSVSSKKI